jgi:hypothetical protein
LRPTDREGEVTSLNAIDVCVTDDVHSSHRNKRIMRRVIVKAVADYHHTRRLSCSGHREWNAMSGRSETSGRRHQEPSPTTNLPVIRESLIGRDRELVIAHQILLREDVGLLTLTGAGGSGKTRLALQLATDVRHNFADGVYLVDLASLHDATLVGVTIGRVLGLPDTGFQSSGEALAAYLRDRCLLLVLDNVEHLMAAASLVGNLLAAASAVKILATSRSPLGLRGESEFPVEPLALPDLAHLPVLDTLSVFSAVALFAKRVTAINP